MVVAHTDRGGRIRILNARRATRRERASYEKTDSDEMRSEYDFTDGVRGKYLPRLAKGANVVVLDRDIAKVFPTSKAVNDALRVLAEAGKRQGSGTSLVGKIHLAQVRFVAGIVLQVLQQWIPRYPWHPSIVQLVGAVQPCKSLIKVISVGVELGRDALGQPELVD